MNTRQSLFVKPMLVASLGCFLAFAVACGDDDDDSNPTPSGGTKNTAGDGGKASGGSGNTAGKTANNNGGAGNETSDAGEGNVPLPPAGGESGVGTGGAAPDCVDEEDRSCYSCAPKTNEQYYNACPTDGCRPFDNSNLTSFVDGKLPEL